MGSLRSRTYLDARRHAGDALRGHRQAIEKRRVRAGRARLGNILGIGGKDAGLAVTDRARHRGQRRVALRAGREREHARRRLGAAADVEHHGFDAGALDGFQGHTHDGGLTRPRRSGTKKGALGRSCDAS